MSLKWVLVAIFALAAFGARADIAIKKSFTPVIPVGPLVEERAVPTYQEEPMGPSRGVDSLREDQEVIFDKRARNFRAESLNRIELDEDAP